MTHQQASQCLPEQQINYSESDFKKVPNFQIKKMSKVISFIKKPVGILTILLVVALGGLGYYYEKYNAVTKDPSTIAKEKAEDAKKKTDAVVKKISDLMILSNTDNAVLATITDKSKLAGQKFFDVAENGDELVLFPNMMKAVIYRPSINKIIDVGPFNPNAGATSTTTASNTAATGSAPVMKAPVAPTKVTASSTIKK